MASESTTPAYLQQEETLAQEWKDFISTLPTQNGWIVSNFYHYQGFWHAAKNLQGIISFQKHFKAQDSDVFLVTTPKSGTTWLKAIMFALTNRKQHHPIEFQSNNHPLLTHNPHDLLPFLEINYHNQISDVASFPSPRLFATHMPYVCLPESVKKSSKCKVVYLCRNPKDTFVSMWLFTNKMRAREMGSKLNEIEEVFERFCNGVSLSGPFWDHVVEYWKMSVDDSERFLFLKYEDMKEQPQLHLRRLTEFLNCPFSADEEEQGMVDQILRLCSFDHLSSLQVNKNGAISTGMQSSSFFRRGEVGDWKNYLSPEMVERLDQITKDKFAGTGLELQLL